MHVSLHGKTTLQRSAILAEFVGRAQRQLRHKHHLQSADNTIWYVIPCCLPEKEQP